MVFIDSAKALLAYVAYMKALSLFLFCVALFSSNSSAGILCVKSLLEKNRIAAMNSREFNIKKNVILDKLYPQLEKLSSRADYPNRTLNDIERVQFEQLAAELQELIEELNAASTTPNLSEAMNTGILELLRMSTTILKKVQAELQIGANLSPE